MYLLWINPPINFTFSDDSVFLKKILAGDINSLNLLVFKSSCKQYSSAIRATQIAPFPIFRYDKYKRGVNYVDNTIFLTKVLCWSV